MSNSTSFVTDYAHKETEYTALVEEASCLETNNSYPGHRRRVPAVGGPPSDHVLIRTAGNALQAIPRAEYEEKVQQKNVLAVSVPSSAAPGDTVMVRNNNSATPQFVQATIPPESVPGKTFFVNVPTEEAPIASVEGAEPLHDLELVAASSQPVPSPPGDASASEFVRVQVPEGYSPGARLLVNTGDGKTVEAIVPADPSIREFYLHVPAAHDAQQPAQAYVV